MTVIDNENVVMYDVDDTLVMWGTTSILNEEFICPYSNSVHHLLPNTKHIDLLKKHKGRGLCVIVWSAGGALWAKEVITKLKLESYVDLIITKPNKYVDDLQASEILGTRIYLK